MAGSDRESLGLMTQQVTYSLSLLISQKSLNSSIRREERGTGLSHFFTMLKGLCRAPCRKQSERQGGWVKGKSRIRNQNLKRRLGITGEFSPSQRVKRGVPCVFLSPISGLWFGMEKRGKGSQVWGNKKPLRPLRSRESSVGGQNNLNTKYMT